MTIFWYGQSCFKIQSADIIIVIDPFVKDIGLTPPRFRADIVLTTHNHKDHANVGTLAGSPFLISGPGEYEIKGLQILGIETFHDDQSGSIRGTNTIFILTVEGMRVVHMGDFGEAGLRSETLEAIGNVDVLMIPVGGGYTIDGRTAAKIINQIEPGYVIPMHYRIPGLTIDLALPDIFLKEMGSPNIAPQEKLALKKKDMLNEDKKTQIVMLTHS